MKYQAPEGSTGISVGGQQFNVDENGLIEVPDDGDYHAMLAPHGFVQVKAKAKTAEEIAADLLALQEAEAAAAKAAAEAQAKADAEAAAATKAAEAEAKKAAKAAEAAAKAAAGKTE